MKNNKKLREKRKEIVKLKFIAILFQSLFGATQLLRLKK